MIKLKLIDRRNQEFEFTEGEHFLGRGPLLQINDPKCSKKQAKLVISEKKILLHSMGKNPMSLYSPQIGWRKIAKDQQTVLHNGDTINLLLNYYPYKISIENTEKKEKEDERFVPDYNDSSQEASLIIEEVFAADPDPPTKSNNNSTNGHKNSSNNNNTSRKVDNEDLSIDLNQIEDEPDSPQITNNDGDLPPVSLADAISEENKKSREREADEKRKKDEELRKEAEKKKKQEEIDLKNLERKKEEERKQAQNSPKKNNTTFRDLFSQKNNTLSKDEVQLPEVKSSASKFSLGSKLNSPPPSPNKASGTTSTNSGNTLTGQKRSRENDSKEQSTPNKRAKTAVSRVIDLDEEIDSQSEEQKRIEAEILKKKRREEEDEELARKLQKKEEELEQKRKDKEFIDDDIEDSEGDFEDEKKSSNKKKQRKSSGSKSGSTPKKQVNKKKRVISSDDEDSEISFDKPALGDDFYKRHSPKANATVTVTPKSTVTVTKKGNASIHVDESSSGSEDIGKSPNKKTAPNKANNSSPRKPTTRSNKKTAKVHTELKYPIDDDDFQ